jgi:7-cyano-7-deazaguanine synthase
MSGKAVALVSGGMDSATTLAVAVSEGREVYGLTLDYGQRNRLEIEAAKAVCRSFGVREHRILQIDLRQFGRSALTDSIPVPKDRERRETETDIPVTYVPARNTIFLSYALAWAEVLEAEAIYIGVNAVDYSGYPDCRPEYIEAFQRMADLATKASVGEGKRIAIRAPLIHLSKAEIIRTGLKNGVDFSLTHSCYETQIPGAPCGHCDSCRLRREGFQSAGLVDPLPYPD